MKLKSPVDLIPIPVTVDKINATQEIAYRVDMLDRFENLIGTLDGVKSGGTLSWSAQASVKGGGSIPIDDLGQGIDWLNARFQIYALVSYDGRTSVENSLGVFLPAAPVSTWSSGNRSWDVELSDKSSILDTDTITDANGNAKTYSLSKGTNVIQIIKAIIADTGEKSTAIADDGNATLASDTTWDAGTTRLKIINDMLDAANYFSIWCDGYGQFQATKYQSPSDRTPLYSMRAPFTDQMDSLLGPDWSNDHDIYEIPNRYVAIQTGSEDDEGMSAVATNMDPSSPFSYPSRGRWITKTADGVEATDQASLDAYAQRQLDSAANVSNKFTVSHLYLPDILVNGVIRFQAGDIISTLTSITNTEITLDSQSLVKTDLLKVTS